MFEYKIIVYFFVGIMVFGSSKSTMYMKRGDHLEPILEPISSTVEPIPIYKLSRGFEIGSIKEDIDKTTLLTLKSINKLKESETRKEEKAKIKPIKDLY